MTWFWHANCMTSLRGHCTPLIYGANNKLVYVMTTRVVKKTFDLKAIPSILQHRCSNQCCWQLYQKPKLSDVASDSTSQVNHNLHLLELFHLLFLTSVLPKACPLYKLMFLKRAQKAPHAFCQNNTLLVLPSQWRARS